MQKYKASKRFAWLMAGAVVAVACSHDKGSDNDSSTGGQAGDEGGGGGGGKSVGGGMGGAVDARPPADAAGKNDGGSDGGSDSDAAASDFCKSALLCENFDSYNAVSGIVDKQKFGPWRAEVKTGATVQIDGAHVRSGQKALHVHIDNTVNSGGRLFAEGMQQVFSNKPTHLYGRMMMYIGANGTSIHWTFFGVSGGAEPNSPVAGRSAQYIMSSLPRNGVNQYSFVYGLQAPDGFHDCSSQSHTPMPSAWACVAFEMDGVARKLRMYKDAAAAPILSIDDHGAGCVAPTKVTDPWYGPAVTSLFVGAYSFHPMLAPLDVWIDDLVVDTKPVSCPGN